MVLPQLRNPNIIEVKSGCKASEITQTPACDLYQIIENIDNYYLSFPLKKKGGGFRIITPPNGKLKSIQYLIKSDIEKRIQLPSYLHGGISRRSILTNARAHLGKDMVVNIDIKDFFPSIKFEMVVSALKRIGYDDNTSWFIGKLVTFNEGLPQGSPTSTLLANLVFLPIDKRFVSFCERRSLAYTRYVDDITVSGNMNLKPFKGIFLQFVQEAGFKVSVQKMKFCGRDKQQIVTGLVVNDRIRPTREFVRRLKKDIRNAWPDALGMEMASSMLGLSVMEFYHNLWGRISFTKSIDCKLGRNIRALLTKVDWATTSPV